MNFTFRNAIGNEMIVTHSISELKAFIAEFGVHIVYDYADGSSDADSEPIHDAETLITEYPEIVPNEAIDYFQGLGEIYNVEVDNYTISICYPIPEIGYETEPETLDDLPIDEQAEFIVWSAQAGMQTAREMLDQPDMSDDEWEQWVIENAPTSQDEITSYDELDDNDNFREVR